MRVGVAMHTAEVTTTATIKTWLYAHNKSFKRW